MDRLQLELLKCYSLSSYDVKAILYRDKDEYNELIAGHRRSDKNT